MERHQGEDAEEATTRVQKIREKIEIQKELISSLKRSDADTTKAERGLAMLEVTLRQAAIARDAINLATNLRRSKPSNT